MTRRRKVHWDVDPMEMKKKASRSCAHPTTSESSSGSGEVGGCLQGEGVQGRLPGSGVCWVQTPGEGGCWDLPPLVCSWAVSPSALQPACSACLLLYLEREALMCQTWLSGHLAGVL